MISCKIFFQLNVKQRKTKVKFTLHIYSSIRFVVETAFISEQIA